MIATEISWAKLTVAVSVLAGAGVAMQLSNCSPLLALLLPIVLLAALVLFDIFGSGERLRLSARGWAVACLAISVLPGMYFYTGCRLPAPAFNDLAAFTGRTVFFSARILSLRQLATDHWQLLLAPAEMHFPRRRQLSGKTVMTVSAGQLAPLLNPDAAAGRTITVRGLVSAPAQSKNAWEFDQCEFLKRSGVFSVVRLLPASAHDGAGASVPALTLKSAEQPESGYLWCNFEKLAVAARVDLVAHHRQYLGERLGDLLSSIVLGDKAVTMERGVIDRFRDIGLSHLLAASGFNMTIVIATTYFMARFICPSLLINNLISFSAMVVYVSLSGMSASIMRASIMCSILLIARSFSASLSIGAALALALLLTIASQPQAITDVGLQLSYLATAGIVSGAAALTRLLSNGSRRKWRLWLAEGVAVVVIAEASVIPVQLVHFWQVGLLFLPANLLVSPLIGPITIVGFCSSLFILLAGACAALSTPLLLLAHLADSLMFVPLWLMMSMVDLLSSYQSAKINLGMPQLPSVAFYYLILIFVVVAIRCQRWLTLAGPLFVLAVYGLVWQPRAPALSIALFPSRLVLIDGARHAVAASYASLGSSKNALQERDIQRFICYSAANFHSEEFAVVHLDERTEVIWQPHRSWCVAVCAGDRQSLKGSLNAALKLIGGRPEITSTVIVIRVPAGNAGQWIGRAASLLPHDFEQRGIHILMVTDEHWSIYRPARPPLLLPSRVGNIPIVESNGVRCESEAASRRFRQLVDIQVESVKQIEK